MAQVEAGVRRPNSRLFLSLIDVLNGKSPVTDAEIAQIITSLLHQFFPDLQATINTKHSDSKSADIIIHFPIGIKIGMEIKATYPKVYNSDVQDIFAAVMNDYKLRQAILFLVNLKEGKALIKKMAANKSIRNTIKNFATHDKNELKIIQLLSEKFSTQYGRTDHLKGNTRNKKT